VYKSTARSMRRGYPRRPVDSWHQVYAWAPPTGEVWEKYEAMPMYRFWEQRRQVELEQQRKATQQRKIADAITQGRCIPPGGQAVIEVAPQPALGAGSCDVHSVGGPTQGRRRRLLH
jgi:hypothetical protein